MRHQFAVIGLGTFGMALARDLTHIGGEVIAIDKDMELVERIKNDVAYAVRLDATDPAVLVAHEVHTVDAAIIAIGDNFEAVVLIAVELLQLGIKRIMARVESATQRKVLQALGISDIISLEEEVAKSVAQRLLNPEIVDLFRLSDDYNIVEIHAPESFWGKTLTQLHLRRHYQCQIITIKRPQVQNEEEEPLSDRLLLPLPQTRVQEGDLLIVLGLAKDIERLTAA